MESEEEGDKKDDEEMDIDTGKKLPKRYANQVSVPEIRHIQFYSLYYAVKPY